jgi:hypothetical protein
MRALMVALDAWVREGVEPPSSRVPMMAHGTLVAGLSYAAVPGLPPLASWTPAPLLDTSRNPPEVVGRYPIRFPRVDVDGHAIAGIRLPVIEVPRASYTGWNPRAAGFGEGALCTNQGGVIPLAATRAERMAAGDPRPSIEERYPDAAAYVAAVRAAAERLVAERLLLAEDAQAMVAAAEAGTLARAALTRHAQRAREQRGGAAHARPRPPRRQSSSRRRGRRRGRRRRRGARPMGAPAPRRWRAAPPRARSGRGAPVEHDGRADRREARQAVLDADRVVGDVGIALAGGGHQPGEAAAEAESHASRPGHWCPAGRGPRRSRREVGDRLRLVEAAHQCEGAFPGRHAGIGVERGARRLPPEQVRQQGRVALRGHPSSRLPQVAVHAEDLVQQEHDAGPRRGGAEQEGRHGAGPVRRLDRDGGGHAGNPCMAALHRTDSGDATHAPRPCDGRGRPAAGGAISPGRTPAEVEALGWRKMQWDGIRPAEFSATHTGGVRIEGQGQGSLVTRPASGAAGCLAWRWRVDAGPPATDLARRGGDDRAVAISIGFAGFGPSAGFATRTQHAVAQASAGERRLPRSVLSYVWGGTGREGQGGGSAFFDSPWTAGITKLRVLRPADAPRGQWVEERVDLGADWRAAFGGTEVPQLVDISISSDTEDTRARVDVQVEGVRLIPCR